MLKTSTACAILLLAGLLMMPTSGAAAVAEMSLSGWLERLREVGVKMDKIILVSAGAGAGAAQDFRTIAKEGSVRQWALEFPQKFDLVRTQFVDNKTTICNIFYHCTYLEQVCGESLVIFAPSKEEDKDSYFNQTLLINSASMGVRSPSLVVFQTDLQMQKTELPDLAINQEVFFLAEDSGIISERYTVGGQVKFNMF